MFFVSMLSEDSASDFSRKSFARSIFAGEALKLGLTVAIGLVLWEISKPLPAFETILRLSAGRRSSTREAIAIA